MSQINTNGINVNYPVPGENNSSQGFRDNFGQIRTNLNTAATEITDLQTKVVLKAALDNSVLNNDMANTQISNCSTRGFRGTAFNLGNALAGTVLVDVNKADVHYGTVTGNVTLQFGSWAPTNTESEVTLRLAVANANAVISLPSQVVSSNNNFGTTLLENYTMIGNTATITAPANTQVLEFTFTSLDCGNTISVAPTNRPFQSTQIITRTPPPTGLPGDVAGTVSVDANYIYVCTANFDSDLYAKVVANTFASGNILQLNNTTNLVEDAPIIFTGNVDTANTNLVANTVYYIANINSPNITVSGTRVAGTAGPVFTVGTKANANIAATAIIGTDIWKQVDLAGFTGDDEVTGNLGVLGNITGGNVRSQGYFYRSVTAGATAAGTVQSNAASFTSEIVEFSTVASGSGAILPAASAGIIITIVNTSANSLNVYPAISDTINSLAVNVAYSHSAGATLQYVALDSTRWYTVGATFA